MWWRLSLARYFVTYFWSFLWQLQSLREAERHCGHSEVSVWQNKYAEEVASISGDVFDVWDMFADGSAFTRDLDGKGASCQDTVVKTGV